MDTVSFLAGLTCGLFVAVLGVFSLACMFGKYRKDIEQELKKSPCEHVRKISKTMWD